VQHFVEAKAAANLHEQGAERKWKDEKFDEQWLDFRGKVADNLK
jgi:hypothetical protein